jgi:hypothetical protein
MEGCKKTFCPTFNIGCSKLEAKKKKIIHNPSSNFGLEV